MPFPLGHDPHVAANVIANAITEQLRPFLEKQEQRDQRMMSMIETLIDKRSHDSQRLERIEARLEKVESRCILEHGDTVRLRRHADDTGE